MAQSPKYFSKKLHLKMFDGCVKAFVKIEKRTTFLK